MTWRFPLFTAPPHPAWRALASRALRDCTRLALTLGLALATGWLFQRLGLPAPYILGAVFGVWLFGSLAPALRPKLGVARWFHVPVVLGLGTMIGAAFSSGLLGHALDWWPTLIAMALATTLATAAGYSYLTRLRGYDPRLALLCSLPGGQAEMILLAKTYTDKDYVVALCHLTRVALVVGLAPLLLMLVTGFEGVASSYRVQAALPHIWSLDGQTWLAFVLCAGLGYGIARLVRLPMPHLLGPLLLSAAGHTFDIIDIPRIREFVILAQLAVGGGIGGRLARVPFAELAGYLCDGLVNAALILASYAALAGFVSLAFGLAFMQAILAFLPGGLYEVTLLALIFGFDLAFVSFHHTLRILIIFFSLPWLASKLAPKS